MAPAIENPTQLNISLAEQQVLKAMFAPYRRVIIRKAFGYGLSGGRVLEVQPITINGTPELPAVAKLGIISLIQKEWQAYRLHIHRRLPYIAQVRTEPVLLNEVGWGGLRYTLMGGGAFEVVTLRDHLRRSDLTGADVRLTLERLFKIMHHIWGFNHPAEMAMAAGYSQLLPVNLLIQHQPSGPDSPQPITPANIPAVPPALHSPVQVSGFVLSKVNPHTQTITLKAPEPSTTGYTLRCKLATIEALAAHPVNQAVDPLSGIVIETRMSRLQDEVRRAFGETVEVTGSTISLPSLNVSLTNPLTIMSTLLQETRPVNLASIHGDFNFENILIEPETGTVSLIDFAEAREGHVLHDLLRLETEVMTKVVPNVLNRHNLPADEVLLALYEQLHRAVLQPQPPAPLLPHPDLEKAWAMIKTIRQTARHYLYDVDDFSEYYRGLALYMLGALKFKNLNTAPEAPLPKQAAFWAATLACHLITSPLDNLKAPLLKANLIPEKPPEFYAPAPRPAPVSAAHAEQRLAALPLDIIPPPQVLPPGSRMPFGRNPLFVGREEDLKQLAQVLKGGETIAIGQVETAATTGLGGIGKTQLAGEFVHRYGHYFAGGIFWLSFAEAKAIPAEVAACGAVGAMELRPNFGELPLEDQIRLVMAEWQKPVPRLLVFDNCEAPELVAQWRPASGGCRVLITSRRIDWEPALGVQALPLDVLHRSESMALLRRHQPNADDATLNAIAAELGDLPLALHLAGSYMARYRRVISPAEYLEQLRDPALLAHPSLKGLGISPTGHVQNVYRTIALSYDKLDEDNPVDE